MCGVFGIRSEERDVSRLAYFGLFALQHRGQESAGVAVSDGGRLTVLRDMGLVAQVSEATTQSSPIRPSVSGRNPCASRKATSVPSESAVAENAPSRRRMAFATASGSGAGSCAMSAAMSSESEPETRRTPSAMSSSRSSSRFTRLPLCPSATVRARPWWMSGCAFAHRFAPVVE